MNQQGWRRRRWMLLPVIAVAMVSAGCGVSSGSAVVVATAGPATIAISPAGTGPVTAGVDVAVVVERRATVTDIAVTEGANVVKGQDLLSVYTIGDSAAISTALNQLRADEKELESVRARDGASAKTTFDLLDKVAQDRQALTDIKSNPLVVTAPIDGRISGLAITAGVQITRTDVVMHVIDDRRMKVTVQIARSYLDLISSGQAAVLTLPGGAGTNYQATVTNVGVSTADGSADVAAVPVTVELPKPADGTLVVGTEAYVRLPITRDAAVTVNSLAVLGAAQQPYVFVAVNGRVEQRPVVTGVSDGDRTEIITGVSAGEQVVISGGQQLVTGDDVRAAGAETP